MKIHSTVYTILIVFLFFFFQIISGCSTTGLQKEDLRMREVDLVSQNLFQIKCSLCHELPDIDGFSSEEWTGIIEYTHDTKAVRKFITLEEAEKIKDYLKRMS